MCPLGCGVNGTWTGWGLTGFWAWAWIQGQSGFGGHVGLKMGLQDLWNLLTKWQIWLSLYQFLGMEARNYKFGMFCRQWHPFVAPGDADIRPRNAYQIHTCHLFHHFVYTCISTLENQGDKPVDQNLWISMPTFGKICHKHWLHGLKNQS